MHYYTDEIDRQLKKQVDIKDLQMCIKTDVQTLRCIGIHIYRFINGEKMYTQTDEYIKRCIDKHMYRQTDV